MTAPILIRSTDKPRRAHRRRPARRRYADSSAEDAECRECSDEVSGGEFWISRAVLENSGAGLTSLRTGEEDRWDMLVWQCVRRTEVVE